MNKAFLNICALWQTDVRIRLRIVIFFRHFMCSGIHKMSEILVQWTIKFSSVYFSETGGIACEAEFKMSIFISKGIGWLMIYMNSETYSTLSHITGWAGYQEGNVGCFHRNYLNNKYSKYYKWLMNDCTLHFIFNRLRLQISTIDAIGISIIWRFLYLFLCFMYIIFLLLFYRIEIYYSDGLLFSFFEFLGIFIARSSF